MEDTYELEKWLWTEDDFEIMGWHDSHIYAISFSPEKSEIAFDIDYIFEWVHPKEDEKFFSFWVSPVTLLFENVYDIKFDINSYNGELEIDSITREITSFPGNPQYIGKNEEWIWKIECQQGEIKFYSVGYKQFVRAKPVLGGQTLNPEMREISFNRGSTDSPSEAGNTYYSNPDGTSD